MNTWRGLLVGGRPGSFSLGRAAFWLVMGLSVWFWLTRSPAEFPPSLESTLGFLLAYNLGGKAVGRLGGKTERTDDHDSSS